MEINNKNIQGIFKYSPDIVFTKGDFVVENLKLYIVKSNSVSGISPSSDISSRYYELYMSEEVINTDEDISKYIKGENSDKLVTAFSVGKMLSSYLSGFNEKGVITNEVIKTGEVYLRDYFGNQTFIGEVNPLDEIMRTNDLNNAIFKVSKEISKGIIGSVSDNLDTAFLRQYTYYDGNGNKIRVQELIDIESGMTMFRYSSESNNFDPTNSWVCGNVGNSTLTMINSVISYYSNKAMNFEKELYSMRGSFRYKSIPFAYSKIVKESKESEKTLGVSLSSFPSFKDDEEFLVTLCISKIETTFEGRAVYRTGSLTVDININDVFYKTLGDLTLHVEKENGVVRFTTSGGSEIKDIYCKQSFESQSTVSSDFRLIKDLTIERSINNDRLEAYSVNLLNDGVSDKNGECYLIVESVEYKYTVTTTGSIYKNKYLVNPIVIDITKGKRNNTTIYTSNTRTHGKCRWEVIFNDDIITFNPIIKDSNNIQDIGSLSGNGSISTYEEITKVTFMSVLS